MSRQRVLVIPAALVLAMIVTAASPAAETVVGLVPSDALVFGVVYRLADVDAKVQSVGKRVQAPVQSVLAQIKGMLGIDKGLDEKGNLIAVLMPGEAADAEPVPVVLVPVADYEQFLAQFRPEKTEDGISEVQVVGQAAVVAKRGPFAAFAQAGHRKTLESVLAAKKDVSGEVSGVAAWLPENDAAWVLTSAGVKLLARKWTEQLQNIEQMMKQFAPNQPSPFGLYIQALKAAEREVTSLAVGVQADKQQNLRMTVRFRFAAEGQAAELLAPMKPATEKLLSGLPGGPFAFAIGGIIPAEWMKKLVSPELLRDNPAYSGLSPEQMAKITEASVKAMTGFQRFAMVMKPSRRGEPIYSNVVGTVHVDDADKQLTLYEKQMEAINDVLKQAKEAAMKPTEIKKTEIGGKPALELGMTITLPKEMPNMEQMMEKLFGPTGKATSYIVAADQHSLVFGFNTTKEMIAKTMDAAKSGKAELAGEADVAKTAALLPVGAQELAFFSPRGMMGMFSRIMAAAMPQPGIMPQVPEFPETPPIGIALKAAPLEMDVQIALPAEILDGIGTLVTRLRQGEAPAVP